MDKKPNEAAAVTAVGTEPDRYAVQQPVAYTAARPFADISRVQTTHTVPQEDTSLLGLDGSSTQLVNSGNTQVNTLSQPEPSYIQPRKTPLFASGRKLALRIGVILILILVACGVTVLGFNLAAKTKTTPSASQQGQAVSQTLPNVSNQEQNPNQKLTLNYPTFVTKDLTVQGAAKLHGLQIDGQVVVQGSFDVNGSGNFSGNISAANFNGDGSSLTNVNAASLGGHPASYYTTLDNFSGTLSTGHLSPDVAVLGGDNTFTASNTFVATSTFKGTTSFAGTNTFTGSTNMASLLLAQPLSTTSGGTGLSSVPIGGVLYGQGNNSLGVATAAGAGLCLVSTTTGVAFSSCLSATGIGVASLNGLTDAVNIANTSANNVTGVITIDNASTSVKGIASFNATNFSVTNGLVNTIQPIATNSSPTFNGLTLSTALAITSGGTGATTITGARANLGAAASGANSDITSLTSVTSITPTAALTVGSTAQSLILQGGATTKLTATSSGNTNQLVFATPTGSHTITLPDAAGTVAVSASGNIALSSLGNISFTGTLGVTNGGTGATNASSARISLSAAASGANNDITSLTGLTTALSLVQGGTGATTGSGARSNIGAAASGANNDITSLSGLTTALSVLQGGTGATTLAANGVLVGNGTSAITSVVAGSNGLCLISSASGPVWQTCTGAGGVSSLDGLNGALTVKGTTNQVIVTDGTSDITLSLPQSIATTSSPGFAGLTLTTALSVANGGTGAATAFGARTNLGAAASGSNADITGLTGLTSISNGAALTIGNTAQNLTLQGSGTTLTSTSGGYTTTVGFAAPTANVTYLFQTAAGGTYDICTTAGNCAGVGGGVTTGGGTSGKLAVFTGSGSIGDSLVSQSGGTVTVGGILAVNTLTPTAALLLGSTAQNTTLQGTSVDIKATNGANTNKVTFATPSGSSHTVTVPNANGTVAVSASGPLAIDSNGNITCASCVTSGGGSGGTGAVDSLNSQTGALTLQGTTNQITVTNGSGTISFSLPQDINTSSSPTFSSLTLSNNLSVANAIGTGSLAVTGAATAATVNGLTLTANTTGFSLAGGTMSKTLTVSANATIDQNLATTASPSFAALSLITALSVSNGGTGSTTSAGARTNLGAAASGANSDITSLAGLTTALSTGQGGTGAGSFTSNGVIYGNGNGALQVTTAGTSGQILQANGSGVPGFVSLSGDVTVATGGNVTIATGAVTSAKILDGTIVDTDLNTGTFTHITGTGILTAGSIGSGFGTISTGNTITTSVKLQGSIVNATTGFQVNGAAMAGTYLRGDGTNFVASAIQAGDLPSGSGNYIQNGTNQQTGNFNVVSSSTTSIAAVIQGAVSGTADLLRINSGDGTTRFAVDSYGNATANYLTSYYGLWVNNGTLLNSTASGTIAAGVRGAYGQTADLLQVQDYNSIALSGFNAAGQFYNKSGSYAGTIAQASLGQNTTYTLPDPGVGSATICLNTGNCAVGGGSSNYIQNGTATQTANFNIQSASGSSIGAVIKGAASQTADLLQLQNSSGTNLLKVDQYGSLYNNVTFSLQNYVGGTGVYSSTVQSQIATSAAGNTGLVIQGASSQIADLLQVLNSTNSVLAKIDAAGNIYGKGFDGATSTGLTIGGLNATSLALGNNANNFNYTLYSGTGGQVNMATGAYSNTVTIGNTTGTTTTTLQAGSGNVNFNASNTVVNGNLGTAFGGFGRSGNLALYSEQLDQIGTWGTFSGFVTANNATAPDGNTTADTISLSGFDGIAQNVTVSPSTTYTFSWWAKRGTLATAVKYYITDQGGGDVVSPTTYTPSSSSWQRFSITFTTGSSVSQVNLIPVYITSGSGTMLVWGTQLEASSSMGVYNRTMGTGSLATTGLVVDGSTFTNNASTLLTAINISNLTSGGSIGSAASTVDIATTINVTQTTAGQSVTIPSPTNTTAGRLLYLSNKGSVSFTVTLTTGSITLSPNTATTVMWNGSQWVSAGIDGSGSNYIQNIKPASGSAQSSNFFMQSADATLTNPTAVIKQVSGQSGDLLQFQNSSGSSVAGINTNGVYTSGQLGIGIANTPSGYQALIANGNNLRVGLAVRGIAAQTGDMFQLQDTNGAIYTKYDANGNLVSNGTNVTLGNLTSPTFSTASTGTTYYYAITATNAQGETTINSTPLGMANNTSTLAWPQIAGATGYKIYRNTTNVFTSGSLLLTTITNGTTVSYTDTGSATTTGLPPTSVTGTGLSIQGWGGQTGNLLQVYKNGGTTGLVVNAAGNGVVNSQLSVASFDLANTTVSKFAVQPGNATTIGQVIRGFASQTADLLQVQNSTGGVLAKIAANGDITGSTFIGNAATLYGTAVGSTPLYAQSASNATAATAMIRAGSGQTGDLLQFQDSTSGVMTKIDKSGNFYGQVIQANNSLIAYSAAAGASALTVQQTIANATAPVAVIKGGATPGTGGDLLQFQDSSGTVNAKVTAYGNVYGNYFQVNKSAYVNSGGASTVGLTVQGATSQSADLLQLKDQNATVLANFDASGVLNLSGASSTNLNLNQGGINTPTGGFGRYQNLLTYSEQEDNAAWIKYNATVATNNATAPDGTNSADTVTISNTGTALYQIVTVLPSTTYTFSWWAKLGTATTPYYAIFDNTHSAFINSPTYAATTNWQRFSATFTTPAGTTSINVGALNSVATTGTMYIWGTQLEQGSSAGTYMQTGSNAANTANYGSVVNGSQTILNKTATAVGATIQGAASQTADLLQLQNSSGTVITRFDKDGTLKITGNTSNTLEIAVASGTSNFLTDAQSQDSVLRNYGGDILFGYANSNSTLAINTTNSTVGIGGVHNPGAQLQINSTAASNVGQIIKGYSGQTADLLQFQDSNGTVLAEVDQFGNIGANYINMNYGGDVFSGYAAQNVFGIHGISGQTGDLLQIQKSDSTTLFNVTANGNVYSSYGTGVPALAIENARTTVYGTLTATNDNANSSPALTVGNTLGTTTAAIIKGAASQSADLLQIQNSSGTAIAGFDAYGSLYSNSRAFIGSDSGARFNVSTSSASQIGQVLKGISGQTGDLLEFQNSSGGIQSRIDSNGNFFAPYLNVSYSAGINSGIASNNALDIQGQPSQTGNLLQLRDNSGNVLSKFDATGQLTIQDTSANLALKVSTTNLASGYNAANATLKIGKDSTTGRSINAAGTINASGADYAEYYYQKNPGTLQPEQIVCLVSNQTVDDCGSDGVIAGIVSANAGYVGNDIYDAAHPGNTATVGMLGQLPVKVSVSNGGIHAGDPIGLKNNGTGQKQTGAGQIVGWAMEDASTDGTITVIVRPQYYTPSSANNMQGGNSGVYNNLNVTGQTNLGNLNVSGAATLASLTVIGDASIGGNLAVSGTLTVTGMANFGDITVNGHFITAGDAPLATAMTALGHNASVTIDGNDTSGTITITTGEAARAALGNHPAVIAPTSGEMASVAFNKVFGKAPRVIITPGDSGSAPLLVYPGQRATDHFTFGLAGTPAPNTTYTFEYFVAQ